MKNCYTFILSFFLFAAFQKASAQAIKLDDNHSLSGIPLNGKLILSSEADSTFWISDGSPNGTKQLSSIKSGNNGYAILKNKIYFAGMNAANGCELWSTDGTASGTVLVSDIRGGADSSMPDDFVVYQDKLLFTAFTPGIGRELYMYPGTGSAQAMTDLTAGAGSSFDSPIYYVLNNTLFFDAMNVSGKALYSFNGLNVQKVFDFPAGYNLASYNAIGNVLFIFMTNGSNGLRIYKTTGGSNATLVQAFSGIFSGMFSSQSIFWNDKIYFTVAALGLDYELWVTDGNITQMVKDINPGGEGSNPLLINSVVLNNKLVFAATTTDSGMELWSTDGTEKGTVMLKDINVANEEGSDPFLLPVTRSFTDFSSSLDNAGFYNRTANYNGFIFFTANNGTNGTELYKTDGTAAGTTLVKDINPGEGDGASAGYLYTKSGFLFSGNDGMAGFEPWISDGSSAGTRAITDINLSGDGNPEFYFVWNGDVYLSADDGNGGEDGLFDFFRLQGPYSPLPATLGAFNATVEHQSVKLSWNTFSEINTKTFEIQRSADGQQFSAIGSVTAAGNSSSELRYDFIDPAAFDQNSFVLYYRLNTIDKDERHVLSKIVKVAIRNPEMKLSIHPNPAHDILRISLPLKNNANLQVCDLNGRTLLTKKTEASPNKTVQINISNLAAGIYILRTETEGKISTIKFVKE
jgi:ELWxxDGT repeat protein